MVLALRVDILGVALIVLLGREGADRVLAGLNEVEHRDAVGPEKELANLIPSSLATIVSLDESDPLLCHPGGKAWPAILNEEGRVRDPVGDMLARLSLRDPLRNHLRS